MVKLETRCPVSNWFEVRTRVTHPFHWKSGVLCFRGRIDGESHVLPNDRSDQFEDLRDIVVVDKADNLTGFGKPDGPIPASSQLVSLLTECGQEKGCKPQTMVYIKYFSYI
jgi:hypothetical protein